ncbi:hypothetical protein BDB01DRAFT_852270 [Pilobolus umbonatus]|nr:hypothetical protein BDB01DRAFT_852270 [Pilobolus umbonatus]
MEQDIKDILMNDIQHQRNKLYDHIERLSELIAYLQSLQTTLLNEQAQKEREFIKECTPYIDTIQQVEERQGI